MPQTIECEHSCCPHPWHRSEDSYGGRTMPSRGQCDCGCHERIVICTVHGARDWTNRTWERSPRSDVDPVPAVPKEEVK